MAVLLARSDSFGADIVPYDHDVYRGSLTLLSDDGFWSRWETEFPIVGGWMSPGSPIGTGNGPDGSIWVHVAQLGVNYGGYGVYDTPISLDQFANPSGIDTSWGWGIYYVYGQNKILEYGIFSDQSPYPYDYTISYSAGVIPEPSTTCLMLCGVIALVPRLRFGRWKG
jgi:hypothetical protein